MEENSLRIMIERFFDAGLSLEEERELCSYLCEHDVPAELRKDKEAIIALCAEDEDIVLPAGAEARLEAMLDSLAADEAVLVADEKPVRELKRSVFKIPRFMWYGAAAVVLLTAGYKFVENEWPWSAEPVTVGDATMVSYTSEEYEEDTFDNPVDAMKCFKGACGDVLLAINTAGENTRDIGDVIKESMAPYRKMINMNVK